MSGRYFRRAKRQGRCERRCALRHAIFAIRPGQHTLPQHCGNAPTGYELELLPFSRSKVWGHDDNTIQRWYEIEMKKIGPTRDVLALVDDPDATYH